MVQKDHRWVGPPPTDVPIRVNLQKLTRRMALALGPVKFDEEDLEHQTSGEPYTIGFNIHILILQIHVLYTIIHEILLIIHHKCKNVESLKQNRIK